MDDGGGIDPGGRDRSRSLDIVIEHADLVAVLLKQRFRVMDIEVLELDATPGVVFFYRGHELLEKCEVLVPVDPVLVKPGVKRVVEERLVVDQAAQ